jgi:hypothetical protein
MMSRSVFLPRIPFESLRADSTRGEVHAMRLFRTRHLIAITALLSFGMTARAGAESFSVKEYNDFHEVLEPLQHEALPKKDFPRIRSNADELVRRGKGILKVGVPDGIAKPSVENFRNELKKFKNALDKFSKDAKSGSDGKLEISFSQVHDSFEMLAGMLPPK